MTMVSMKVERDDTPQPIADDYGYGLCINLDDDQVEALGINSPIKAGEVVTIKALAFVKRSEESIDGDGDGEDAGTELRLSLQITDMELSHDDGRSSAQKMYAKSDMEA